MDESLHRIVRSTLLSMQLEGVPFAERVGKNKYRYRDSNGTEINKDVALRMVGGLVWHVDLADPAKGSLRCRGRFISRLDAQAILSASKAGGIVGDGREREGLDGGQILRLLSRGKQ